ncbi:NAD(P)-binding protein [Acrasis kona]|uniref:NAD(P)-binding protein n=1 Tax=Acrasis kona TaxID=1008807 RepID=A0AAW2YSZ2_9EUKA
MDNYYDIQALDRAVKGVDAIICAYSGLPELHLDGQLLLLRAAERSGVERFLAAGWNYDWRNISLGDEPIYDAAIAFHAQASITSTIKPLHIFSGMFVEVFFGACGQAGFTPRDNGVWDPINKSMDIYGTGDEEWCFTTESDAGKFGVEAVTHQDAKKGGFISTCSFRMSLRQVQQVYEQVRGAPVQIFNKGPLSMLQQKAEEGKNKHGRAGFWNWHVFVFHANCISGVWNLKNDEMPDVEKTSLEKFLEIYPDV